MDNASLSREERKKLETLEKDLEDILALFGKVAQKMEDFSPEVREEFIKAGRFSYTEDVFDDSKDVIRAMLNISRKVRSVTIAEGVKADFVHDSDVIFLYSKGERYEISLQEIELWRDAFNASPSAHQIVVGSNPSLCLNRVELTRLYFTAKHGCSIEEAERWGGVDD